MVKLEGREKKAAAGTASLGSAAAGGLQRAVFDPPAAVSSRQLTVFPSAVGMVLPAVLQLSCGCCQLLPNPLNPYPNPNPNPRGHPRLRTFTPLPPVWLRR